jgi:hypothetical protein
LPRLVVALALAAVACPGDDSGSGTAVPASAPAASVADVAVTDAAEATEATEVTEATEPDDARRPVVMDTDMSVEEAMSVLFMLTHPDVRVEAITISGTGLVSCRRGVDQALGLVALADPATSPSRVGRPSRSRVPTRFQPPFARRPTR